MTVLPRLLVLAIALAVGCGHGVGSLQGLLENGEVDEVLRISEEGLAKNPHDLTCLAFKARALEQKGQLGDAKPLWQAILRTDPRNQEAFDRLLHFAGELPDPSLVLDLSVSDLGGSRIGKEQADQWRAASREADSLMAVAKPLVSAGMFEDAAPYSRRAIALDGARLDRRSSFCLSLLSMSARGGSRSERILPLQEAMRIGESHCLSTAEKQSLQEVVQDIKDALKTEATLYQDAVDYTPWPGAPYRAEVDSTRFFPTVYISCGEGSYADIRVVFSPEEDQYVVSGRDILVRAGPRPDARILTRLSGRVGVHVIERLHEYCLVRIGDFNGWVLKDHVAEKRMFEFELDPRGSIELSFLPSKPNIRIEVNDASYFRGQFPILPYLHYRWNM